MAPTRYVIVGNGAAGIAAAESIRQVDADGSIAILAQEPYPMYSRPGLAYVLTNEIPLRQVQARTLPWYSQQRFQLYFGKATRLGTETQTVYLEDGLGLAYDRLLIATGARAMPAPYSGADLDGVVYLDTLEGTQTLLKKARRGRRAVVIGGGITALEMVEGLAHRGLETHYFLRRHQLWDRVLNQAESRLLEGRLVEHGIHLHPYTEVKEILGNWRGRVRAVRCADDQELVCDVLGVGIGVRPQLELVRGTPIQTDRAILVNEYLETNVPNIYAAGDCAQVYDRWSQRHLTDVLWPSAVAQGRAAGRNMAANDNGLAPLAYRKGIPFNACLLFGMHITAIGQITPQEEKGQAGSSNDGRGRQSEVIQHVSEPLGRGSSDVWFTFPRNYRSAWSEDGANSLRLTLDGSRLVGALIMGEQSLADPLRHLIEQEADTAPLRDHLHSGYAALKDQVWQLWRAYR